MGKAEEESVKKHVDEAVKAIRKGADALAMLKSLERALKGSTKGPANVDQESIKRRLKTVQDGIKEAERYAKKENVKIK